MTDFKSAIAELRKGVSLTLASAPDGFDALAAADLARALAAAAENRSVALVHVARDGQRSRAFVEALGFFAPEIEALDFPAWDCQPYDRVSPHAGVVAQRMTVLSRLARLKGRDKPSVLLTTVNAVLQRVLQQQDAPAAAGDAGSALAPPVAGPPRHQTWDGLPVGADGGFRISR